MPSSAERWLACALAGVLGAPAAHAAGRLTVPPEVVVAADPVRLRDVAVLDGEGAVALAEVVLVPAPRAGESRTLDGGRLLETLRRAGLDASVTYTVPATIRLRRATQEIAPHAVRGVIEEWLRTQLGPGADDAYLEHVETYGPLVVPAGAWTAAVHAPPGVVPLGRVRLELELLVDGAPVRTAWVTAEIARFGEVVVATRQIARGEQLRPGDVALQRLELSGLPRSVLTDPAEAEGGLARQALTAWAPIRREHLGTPVAVRRGDAVVLVAERGALRVTAAGEARQDAARGDAVAVVNRGSGKALVGRVLDAGTVAVEF